MTPCQAQHDIHHGSQVQSTGIVNEMLVLRRRVQSPAHFRNPGYVGSLPEQLEIYSRPTQNIRLGIAQELGRRNESINIKDFNRQHLYIETIGSH